MATVLWIAGGGAVGSLARYWLALGVARVWPTEFPFGTMLVNLLGCFLFGVVAGLIERGNVLPPNAEMLLLVGFMGAFTTFSTFAFHNTQMLQQGQLHSLAANLVVQNVAGVILLLAGLLLARPQ